MELSIRPLVKSDLEHLHNWWESWGWPRVTTDLLPLDGLGGLMVYKGETLIAAGFLYLTNSKVAWLEWIISNKKYRDKDKRVALELLISSLEEVARQQGFKIVISIAKNKTLFNLHRKLGYTIDENPSYEITKKIQ